LGGLAAIARDTGDDETAPRFYERITKIDPNDRGAWVQTAYAAHRLGRELEAFSAAHAAMAIEADPVMSDFIAKLASTPQRHPLEGSADPGHPMSHAGPGLPRPPGPDPTRHFPTPGRTR
jgi:hypothetical protein